MQTIRHPSVLASPALLAAACALTACAVDAEPTLDQIEIGTDCPNFGCNSNSPVVGGVPFHELDEGEGGGGAARRRSRPGGAPVFPPDFDQGGAFNEEELRVVHIRKGPKLYRLDVDGAVLRALNADGTIGLKRDKLVGSVIVLEHTSGTLLYVFIVGFSDSLRFWIGDEDNIETFYLTWAFNIDSPESDRQPVCPDPAPTSEWFGAAWHQAIFFQGDRYAAKSKRVTAIGSDTKGWFNVACAGSATAKMHTNRFTDAGSDETHTTTRLNRQMLLKMYVADYCNTGHAFTEIGEPLQWGLRNWKTIDLPGPLDYEAVWGPDGALCLSTPRMGDSPGELAETMDSVDGICNLSDCADLKSFPNGYLQAGYIVTANPPPD